tara:strand:+ start:196 stop:414 length:219 start_codon:yes stop_codon:yes gene_type:complete
MSFSIQVGTSDYTFRDSQEAFEEAILHGYLTTIDYEDGKYAGEWMYMHTIGTTDYFKNINTRKYLEIPYTNI